MGIWPIFGISFGAFSAAISAAGSDVSIVIAGTRLAARSAIASDAR